MRWEMRRISIGKGVGGLGLGGIIILLLLGWLFKGDPLALLNTTGDSGAGTGTMTEQSAPSPADDKMADFYAGVWAYHTEKAKDILESGDIQEALNAASAIGNDRIQKQTQGYVVPDAFTHGTSEQRVRWFREGFETGDLRQGDTFSAKFLQVRPWFLNFLLRTSELVLACTKQSGCDHRSLVSTAVTFVG